mgnify:CR=1 FL=1
MKLKNLFKSYLDMSYEEQTKYIVELRIKRMPLSVIKKSKRRILKCLQQMK